MLLVDGTYTAFVVPLFLAFRVHPDVFDWTNVIDWVAGARSHLLSPSDTPPHLRFHGSVGRVGQLPSHPSFAADLNCSSC